MGIFEKDKRDYFERLEDEANGKKFIRRYEIKDSIPVLISKSGELICLPRERDPWRVAFFGGTGTGKSLMMHGMMERIFYYQNQKVILINDYLDESLQYESPMENKKFVKDLSFIQEKPLGLKNIIRHFFPNHPDVRLRDGDFKIAIKYEDFIKNLEFFMGKLDGSKKHYDSMRPKLLECKRDRESIKKAIYNFELPMKKEAADTVKGKIWTLIRNAIDYKIIDLDGEALTEVEIRDEDFVKHGTYNPLMGFAYLNQIPCLHTSGILNEDYFPQMYSYLMESLFKSQKTLLARDNKIFLNLFCDEITLIASKEQKKERKEYQDVVKVISKFASSGRFDRIGFFYATQSPSTIPSRIKTNTKVAFCTQLDEDEAKEVARMFNYDKKTLAKELGSLDKNKRECLAITNERLLALNPFKNEGNYITQGIVSGIFLPPMSNTVPPAGEEA